MNIATVILAAGFGTRMKSTVPKVVHKVGGRSLVEWSVRVGKEVSQDKPTVVVGHGKECVEEILGDTVHYVTQSEQLGTGHAVQQAESNLRNRSDAVIVIYGDMPLLRSETLISLASLYEAEFNNGDLAIAMLTIERDDPQGFGRIVRDEDGKIQAIVEQADCTPEQMAITELNPGIYCFNGDWLWDNLSKVPLSAKGEYYLTDMVGIAVSQGRRVVSTLAPIEEVNGINTRVHLAHAEQVMRERIIEKLMVNGVTVIDPANTYVDDMVEIGADSVILPGTMIQGKSSIGTHCTIGPNTHIVDGQIGNHCVVNHSVVEEASMSDECDIGPFGHLRKGAKLDVGVHMGNFGEVKNSYLGPGVKMGHFSYIGDAQIGANVNIGAGTITCNYDGQNKHKTHIGKDSFIGSDTMLVAPLHLGEGSRTGAGSVVTKDVANGELVYGVPAKSSSKVKSSQ